jgi:tetratricopeptide (TPR) repeat protein
MNRSVVAALTAMTAIVRIEPAVAQAPAADVEALYAEGVRHYNVGEYDAAIDAFKRAYLISNAASLLYNIAQAYRKQGPPGCEPALEFYRGYLRERPGAPDRASIEATIDELDPCPAAPRAAAPAVVPAIVAAPPAVVRDDPAGPSGGQLALGVAGATLLVGGGVTFGIAAARYGALQDECPCPRERWTAWRNAEYGSYVALGLGAASLGTAVIWWLAQRGSERPGAMAVQLVPSVSGATVTGSF